MLPVQKPKPQPPQTLDEIRERKDQLLEELNADNSEFGKKWHQLFVSKESSSKAEFVTGLIANSITAIDAFLVVRKLIKNYGGLFGFKKKSKR
jgi:hypothetical protein